MFNIEACHCSSMTQCNIDHTILTMPILNKMLHIEDSYTIAHDYFTKNTHNNRHCLDASMRSTLTTWMLEVCEEEQCTNDVFSLAVNIFDRFMCSLLSQSQMNVEKYHLQLFGITCLFIASKLKASSTSTLTSLKLVDYTAHSVTLSELLEWESLVLNRLKWDIAAVMPNDYLEFFLHAYASKDDVADQVRKHAYAFTALCATDFALAAFQPASMIASACFLNALSTNQQRQCVANELARVIRADLDTLWMVCERVEELFKQTQIGSTSLQDFDFIQEDDLFQFEEADNDNDDSSEAENFSYDALINGFESSSSNNDFKNANKQLKYFGGYINVTSDSLFDCINDLNLNDYDTDYVTVKKTTTEECKKPKKSESSRSSVSSDSSGVSSGACSSSSRSNCFQLTPPLANLLPMPTFEDTVTKKSEESRSTRSTRRKQKLVLF
jgi:hypothetical protein